MHLEVHEVVQGVVHVPYLVCTCTPMYPMYKDRHVEKCKRVIRHIKLISMHPSHTAIHV
jgi:hypothetical protein